MEYSERQNEIIKAAIKIIAHNGIQSLTTKNLAREIGISEAGLYRHFPSKHKILHGVLDRFEQVSGDCSALLSKDLTPLDKIRTFLEHRYSQLSKDQELAKVMFAEEIFQNEKDLSDKVLSIMHSHRIQLEMFIREGQEARLIRESIDPKSLFRVIVGSMRLLVTQWCLTDFRFDLENEGKILWDNVRVLISTG